MRGSRSERGSRHHRPTWEQPNLLTVPCIPHMFVATAGYGVAASG